MTETWDIYFGNFTTETINKLLFLGVFRELLHWNLGGSTGAWSKRSVGWQLHLKTHLNLLEKCVKCGSPEGLEK